MTAQEKFKALKGTPRYSRLAALLDDLVPGAQGMPQMVTEPLQSYLQLQAVAAVIAAELDAMQDLFDEKLEDLRSRVTDYVELKPGEEAPE